jgi:hypothetical protein
MKKNVLNEQLQDIYKFAKKYSLYESLVLKRKDDKIYVVSDDPTEKSKKPFKDWETVRNKEKLKAAGFRFDGAAKEWWLSTDKLQQAQEIIAKINNNPIEKLIDQLDAVAKKKSETPTTTPSAENSDTTLKTEITYKGNVGISELMDFYKKAPSPLVSKVDMLLKSDESKLAWRIILRFLKKNNELDEVSWKDVKKGAIGVGLAGLMATTSLGATGKKHTGDHIRKSAQQTSTQKAVTRGIRNNNPGNIKKSETKWKGKIGEDGKFEIFDTPENGIRALTKIIKTYNNKYNLNTIAGIIKRWAPPHENDTKSYIKNISKKVGINYDDKIDLSNTSVLTRLIKAIIEQENGRNPYNDLTLSAGISKS